MATFCKLGGGAESKVKTVNDGLTPVARTVTVDITEYDFLGWRVEVYANNGAASNITVSVKYTDGRVVNLITGNRTGGTHGYNVDIKDCVQLTYSRSHNWNNQSSFFGVLTRDQTES